LPLLIAADLERGLDSRVNGTPSFPDAMAFGAAGGSDRAEKYGAIVAEEARAVGIHWNFFPVADVNSNPNNQSSTHALLEKILLWWATGVGLHQRRSGTWDAYHSEALSWTR